MAATEVNPEPAPERDPAQASAPGPDATARARGAGWRLGLGCWLLLLCVAHGNLESIDSGFTMQGARALWTRGDSGLLLPGDGAATPGEGLAAAHIAGNSGQSFGMTGKDGRHQYVWFPMGHLWLMVPPVALGEHLQRAFPAIEARYKERAGPTYQRSELVLDQAMVALLLPSLFGATTILLLMAIARALGSTAREALGVAFAIAFTTQCFPLLRETLSDGPGLTLLLTGLWAAVRAGAGAARPGDLVLGGLAAGFAVLVRYQHAFPVVVLAVAVALAARRHRRWPWLWCFAAGGAPMAALLFTVNWLRFGNPMSTGYLPADWFDTMPWIGLPKILLAAGKGILWFSPLLWIAAWAALRRRERPPFAHGWLAWTLLWVPLLMFASTNGWQSGQCWGVRYVTGGVVAFQVLVLPQLRPWRRWPRAFAALLVLGALVNVTSLVAPTRGYAQLADQGVRAQFEQAFAAGEVSAADLAAVRADSAGMYFVLPRFSPLHANWSYARQVLAGAFEDEHQRPVHGAAHTIEPLFSVTSADPQLGLAPIWWEDRGFRWWWWVMWGELLGLPGWLLLLPPLVAGGALVRAGWRRLSRI
ncbi:MAG: hypothetical protein AB7O97_09405 [Planctomycetota bacterium]